MLGKGQSYVALLVSQDNNFKEQMETVLQNQFKIRTYCFGEHDLRETLRLNKPVLILWDGRQPSSQSLHLLQWLREHFQGCPILALLDNDHDVTDLELYKLGINLWLDTSSSSFYENLSSHIEAVIQDCETIGYNSNPRSVRIEVSR